MNSFSDLLDSIPVVGHAKGLIHYAVGDEDGAKRAVELSTTTLSNVLDSVPVVGHTKGLIHYAVGDEDGGNKAMYQSTRTIAVIGGGVVGGAMGGPAGAVGGAMYAGFTTDSVASGFTHKPQGTLKHIANVGNDLIEFRNPCRSLVATGVHLGCDALGGLGMGGLSSESVKNVGKSIVTNVGKETTKLGIRNTCYVSAHALTETAADDIKRDAAQKKSERGRTKENNKEADKTTKRESNTATETSQSRANTESGSGSQPPQENKDNKENTGCTNESIFSEFLKLLEEILGSNSQFYKEIKNLSTGQIKYLERLLKRLKYYGTRKVVLNLVIQIFVKHFPSKLNFVNFLSMTEFVSAYVNNEIEEQRMIAMGTDETPSRRITANAIDFDVLTIVNTFNKIRGEIERELANEPVNPDFRDIFTAVYHYFKHRIVPVYGTISVKEYFNFTRDLLRRIQTLSAFDDWFSRGVPGSSIVSEIYIPLFGRVMRIVIKFGDDGIVLSTCFVVDTYYDQD